MMSALVFNSRNATACESTSLLPEGTLRLMSFRADCQLA